MKLSQRYIILLLIALVLGVYYPTLFVPLCLTDDYVVFMGLVDVKYSWKSIFVPGTVSYYRPLFDVSLWVDQILWMFEESFMHLDNILMHLANVILVYFIALRAQLLVFKRKTPIAACATAAIFAVHPTCSESINWILARVDPMAAFFINFALLFMLIALYNNLKRYYILSFICLIIGSLAKEVAVFMLPAFLFISFSYWRGNNSEYLKPDLPDLGSFANMLRALGVRLSWVYTWVKLNFFQIIIFSLVPMYYFVIRRLASTEIDKGTATTYTRITAKLDVSIWDPIFLTLKALGFYLKKMFIPWPLNFNIVYISDWYILLGIIFVFLIIYLLWQSSFISSFFMIAFMTIAAAVLVLLAGIGWTPYAERYLYIAVAPVIVGFMLFLQSSKRIERYKVLLPVTIIAIFALTTVNRNLLWTDSLAFYKQCIELAPDFRPAARNYAAALAREGMHNEANEFRRNHVPAKSNGELFSVSNKRTSVR